MQQRLPVYSIPLTFSPWRIFKNACSINQEQDSSEQDKRAQRIKTDVPLILPQAIQSLKSCIKPPYTITTKEDKKIEPSQLTPSEIVLYKNQRQIVKR